MKILLITTIFTIVAHQAVDVLMASDTVRCIQNHNKQIEIALGSAK